MMDLSGNIKKEVLIIFSQELNHSSVSLEDNFYDLGGDSLTAMRIKNELEDKLSLKVSIENIMLSEDIGELLENI